MDSYGFLWNSNGIPMEFHWIPLNSYGILVPQTLGVFGSRAGIARNPRGFSRIPSQTLVTKGQGFLAFREGSLGGNSRESARIPRDSCAAPKNA